MMRVELTEKQERFAAWLALRVEDRPVGQRSKKDMAEVLGVNQATLYRWQQQQSIRDRTYEIINEAVASPEMVGQLVRRLHEIGLSDDRDRVNAIEKFLKYAGVLVDRQKVETQSSDEVSEMADEELLAEWDAEMKARAEDSLNAR